METPGRQQWTWRKPCLKPASVARIVELVRTKCTKDEWAEWLRTPFERAGAEGDEELVAELALVGAYGDPFAPAIRGGHYELLKNMLPNDNNPPDRYLRLAATLGNEPIVSLLLSRGANPDPRDHWTSIGGPGNGVYKKESWTPLLLAAKSGHAGIVGLLLDAGASAHRRLKQQAVYDDSDLDEACGAPVEMMSASDLASARGRVDVIKAIARRAPSALTGASPRSGFTALHHAARNCRIGSIDALVEAGADLEAGAGKTCGTALHAAVASRHCEATVRSLLGHGANIESTGRVDTTPLCTAVKAGNLAAATTLVTAGADVSRSLLIYPDKSLKAMTRALVRWGADVNERDACGYTPLHLAADECSREWVDELLKAGGDETAVNGRGELPVDVANRRGHMFLSCEARRVKALLTNAPRDRANRAWSRRGFFMLCRTFPGRVRLQLGLSEDRDAQRVATGEAGGGEEEQHEGGQKEEDVAAFRTAMVRFMDLEADVVFRKIVEFL